MTGGLAATLDRESKESSLRMSYLSKDRHGVRSSEKIWGEDSSVSVCPAEAGARRGFPQKEQQMPQAPTTGMAGRLSWLSEQGGGRASSG